MTTPSSPARRQSRQEARWGRIKRATRDRAETIEMPDQRLPRLLELRRHRPDPEDESWRLVEGRLGLGLPGDYKNLIDVFGESSWGDFLHILSPFSDDRYLGLTERGQRISEADRTSRTSFPALYPLPLYPEAGGLLPWAVTDNGDTLYWITAAPPDEWPTLIKGARSPDFEVNFSPSHLIVYQFGAGRLRSTILPSAR